MRDSGDAGGYATVFAEHSARLRHVAELVAGDSEIAADAVAEAFARTYPHWRRGRVEDVGAYLRRAVVNEIRRGWRRRERAAVVVGAALHVDAGDDRVAERDRVLRALAELPVRQRAAVVLRYYDDLSEAAIADVLGMPAGTVKSTLSRALSRLRPALEDAGGAGEENTGVGHG